MADVRCRQCGQLVPAAQYAGHVPCSGPQAPQGGPQPATALPGGTLAWGSLRLPPGHLQRGDDRPAHLEPRLGTARGRVQALMQDGEWHSAQEITAPSVGGSEGLRRLRELRDHGFHVEKRRISAGVWEYRLTRSAT